MERMTIAASAWLLMLRAKEYCTVSPTRLTTP